jgi:adenylate cyclase
LSQEGEDRWCLHPVTAWLLREGWRHTNRRLLFEEIGRRFNAAGVPIWRMAAFIPTLHPELFADSFFWNRDSGKARYQQSAHSLRQDAEYQNSPLLEVGRTGKAMRRRLTGPNALLDFPILGQLAEQGATDYLVLPVKFSRPQPVYLTFATDHRAGFSDEHIQALSDLAEVFAPIIEAMATQMIAVRLLDTYVGRNAGQRVLAGQIGRGSGETISAAIWYCDLRGFTALSDRLPRDRLIATLNDYFDCMGSAVERHKGEVLKFIGDAMLAIFPVEAGQAAACQAAVAAARESIAAMDALNARRHAAGEGELEYGIALHVGDVMYGNIGTSHRLDFTVIGPAVNYASRLERMCRELRQKLVMSADVARHLGSDVRSAGRHNLRSIAEPQEIFVPAL